MMASFQCQITKCLNYRTFSSNLGLTIVYLFVFSIQPKGQHTKKIFKLILPTYSVSTCMLLWTCTLVHLTRRIENVTRWLICVHLSRILMSNVNIVNGDCGEMFGIWQNIFWVLFLLYNILHFYVYQCFIYMYVDISWFLNHKMCLCFRMWLRVLCSSFQKEWIIVKRGLFIRLLLCMPAFANIFIIRGTWRAQPWSSERLAINTNLSIQNIPPLFTCEGIYINIM